MRPYSDTELLHLLNEVETDNAERKESFGDSDKARQAVCAFANDLPNHNKPGVLFVGAKDNGTPSNLPITDKLLLDLSNEQDERILIEKRRYKNKPFDHYPISDATVEDLSRVIFEHEYLPVAVAPEILEANNRTYEEKLASCGMIVSPQDTTPTILGVLTVGKNPQDILIGAYIQFLRINGTQLADDVIDDLVIGGAIPNMLRMAQEKLTAHNFQAVNMKDAAKHKIEPTYPLHAVLQILYNAVQHRTYEYVNAPIHLYWYNDRIEIRSPGGPFGNVTPENFGEPGIVGYRNPGIGSVLKTLGFIQSFGRGIEIARRELERNGNPPLEFTVNDSFVLCTIRRKA